MWNLVSMIIMSILWNGRQVTLCQNGRIVALGKVSHISDHWLVIRNVVMAKGQGKKKLAVGRNRIDAFWEYENGDERHLATYNDVIPSTVDSGD